ncbi:MAG: hypothetical protein H7843_09185 [Nitrospirota bacterium]
MEEKGNLIPNCIDICGINFPVIMVNPGEIDDSLGRFKTVPASIMIRNDAASDIQLSTLLHEIIEVINWQFEIGLEHKIISTLSSALFQALKTNNIRFQGGMDGLP